ncbi:uncharacterized protein LOC144647360 [Oculina patagonica]
MLLRKKNRFADTECTEFSLFVRGALNELLRKAVCESVEQRAIIYNHLWKCYPFLHGSEKLFTTFALSGEKKELGGDSEIKDALGVISKCQQVTFGCCSELTIGECMKVFVSELTPWCEDCLKQSPSEQRKRRALDLKSCIHNLVMLMHFRWLDCKKSVANVQCKESYGDHMAALLSLYFDMTLLSERDSAEITAAGNLLFQVLGFSPVLCMDVVVQLSAITQDNGHLVIPVIRTILKRNIGPLTHSSYIKFIYLSRSVMMKQGDVQEFASEIKQIAEGQAAPVKFVAWLKRHDERLKEKLGLQRKMTGYQVTKQLLQCKNSDALEYLFEIACDIVMEGTASTIEETGQFAEEAQEPNKEPVFFVDASGDADIDQGVEYEEHDKKETLLHRQLKTLIMQMEKDFESEDEDVEVLPGEFLGNSNDSLQAFSEKLRKEDIAGDGLTEERMDARQIKTIDSISASNLKANETRDGPDKIEATADCCEVHIKMIDDKDVNLVVESSQEDENTSAVRKGATKTRSKRNIARCTTNKNKGSSSRDKQQAHQVTDKRKGSLYSDQNEAPQQKRSRKAK